MTTIGTLPPTREFLTDQPPLRAENPGPPTTNVFLRGIQAAAEFLAPIPERIRSLPLRTKIGLAVGAIAATALQPNDIPDISPLSPDDATAIIKGDISHRPNGVASPPLPGTTMLHFRGIDSLGEIYTKYEAYYLYHCTYSMSQNQLNESIRRLASKDNDNADLLFVTTNPKNNFFAKNAIAKRIRDFNLTARICTTPVWEPRTRYTIHDEEDLKNKADRIRSHTGCSGVSLKYWFDIVHAYNIEKHDSRGTRIYDIRWSGIDPLFRFPICFKVDRTNLSASPQPKNSWIVIDEPFTPEYIYEYYGEKDENPKP